MITRAERAALAQAGLAALIEEIPAPREPEAEGPQLPAPADLDAATAATAAAIAGRTATLSDVERLAEAEAATCAAYVTEIWCPMPDNGIQRLHSSMKEPEPEAEADNWYCADYDAEAAEYDIEPEAGL